MKLAVCSLTTVFSLGVFATALSQNAAPSSHLVFDDRFAGDIIVNELRVGEKDVNGILDAVMRVGAEVVSVTPHRSCLEDVFLDAVRAGDEAADEPGGEG